MSGIWEEIRKKTESKRKKTGSHGKRDEKDDSLFVVRDCVVLPFVFFLSTRDCSVLRAGNRMDTLTFTLEKKTGNAWTQKGDITTKKKEYGKVLTWFAMRLSWGSKSTNKSWPWWKYAFWAWMNDSIWCAEKGKTWSLKWSIPTNIKKSQYTSDISDKYKGYEYKGHIFWSQSPKLFRSWKDIGYEGQNRLDSEQKI